MGAFKTLAFFLGSYRKLESLMGPNSWMGKKGCTHALLVDFMVTTTFQTLFQPCSTVFYCGPLLLRLKLIVTSNDNWQTGLDPHLWDVSQWNWRIHRMLQCQHSDLGYCFRSDQVQGAIKSQLQRHCSYLHWLDKGAKVSSKKGWWQTGGRTKSSPSSHTQFGWAHCSKLKDPLFRLQTLNSISVGCPIDLTSCHACNDIWTRSQVVSSLGKVIRW